MDPELLAQFPVAEAAIEALGLVLWPMVEYEADDAIAAAAERFAADPRVERILICTPDKDMAQCVRDERVVLWDRRRDLVYDDAGVRAKWGVPPSSVADRLALVGDAADGFPGLPGWGDKSASAVLARYGTLEAIPANAGDWDVPGLRGAPALAATLRERMDEALLYRDLARLRTTADGVPIPPGRRRRAPLARAPTGPRWDGVLRRVGPRAAGRTGRIAGRARTSRARRRARSRIPRATARAAPRGAPPAPRRSRTRGSPCRRRTRGRRPCRSPPAPPRSAISPAAATSQADMPPDWRNASNRPFAT